MRYACTSIFYLISFGAKQPPISSVLHGPIAKRHMNQFRQEHRRGSTKNVYLLRRVLIEYQVTRRLYQARLA
jgi:hypothetical protein